MASTAHDSVLVRAVNAKNLPLVTRILKEQNISNKTKSVALSAAITNKLTSIISVLLDNGCTLEEVQHEWCHLLHVAIDNKLLRVTDHLLNTVKIIEKAPNLLHKAVEKQYLQVAEWLINNNADMNCKHYGMSLLHHLVMGGGIKVNKKFIELFLNNGVTFKNEPELFAMVIHSFEYQLSVIEAILQYDKGFNINEANEDGDTPLLIVMSQFGQRQHTKAKLKVIIQLINSGANVNHRNNRGISALCLACLGGKEKFVKVLLKAKSDIHLIGYSEGGNPLHVAARVGSPKICLMLLKAGANVNAIATDRDCHRNALSYACHSGRPECVSLLLEHGADLYVSDYSYASLIEVLQVRIDEDSEDNIIEGKDYEGVIEILQCHIIKLVIACLQIAEDDLSYFATHLKDNELVSTCARELAIMQTVFFLDDISYFDILTSPNLVNVLRNEETRVVVKLRGNAYKRKYPLYGHLLASRINIAKKKAILMNTSSNCLRILSGDRFPHLVTDNILTYLNELDMQNLTQAINGPQ